MSLVQNELLGSHRRQTALEDSAVTGGQDTSLFVLVCLLLDSV